MAKVRQAINSVILKAPPAPSGQESDSDLLKMILETFTKNVNFDTLIPADKSLAFLDTHFPGSPMSTALKTVGRYFKQSSIALDSLFDASMIPRMELLQLIHSINVLSDSTNNGAEFCRVIQAHKEGADPDFIAKITEFASKLQEF